MPHDFVDNVFMQCAYAIGCGARMKIELTALVILRDHLEKPEKKGLRFQLERPKDQGDPDDTEPGEERWKTVDGYILDCCEAIGRLAAANASKRGSRFINLEDLASAYNTVSDTNAGPPGVFCPDFP